MGLGTSSLEKAMGNDFPPGEHYLGFENYGNTCYSNSVLQALYFCVPFRQHIIHHYEEILNSNKGEPEDTLLTSLCELFYSIHTSKKRTGTIGPRKFISKLRKENELFRGFMHQDAHEFLNYLLNEVAEKLEKQQRGAEASGGASSIPNPGASGKTLVHNIFEGILTNETKCLTCESVTSKNESFLDLSLDIEQNSSITHCLSKFSSTETLCGREKFYCDSCRSKQEAEKRIKIHKLPKILVLHLKRFKFVEQMQRYKKLSHRVSFPLELRLQNTTDDAEDPERLYDLFAIVIHIGSGPNHGHYVSIVKSCDRWLLFDDENIELIEEQDIRACFGSTNEMMNYPHHTDCGYLLFYRSTRPEDGVQFETLKSDGGLKEQQLNNVTEREPYCL